MDKIIFKSKLNNEEINKYCVNNNYILMFVENKNNNTILNVVRG